MYQQPSFLPFSPGLMSFLVLLATCFTSSVTATTWSDEGSHPDGQAYSVNTRSRTQMGSLFSSVEYLSEEDEDPLDSLIQHPPYNDRELWHIAARAHAIYPTLYDSCGLSFVMDALIQLTPDLQLALVQNSTSLFTSEMSFIQRLKVMRMVTHLPAHGIRSLAPLVWNIPSLKKRTILSWIPFFLKDGRSLEYILCAISVFKDYDIPFEPEDIVWKRINLITQCLKTMDKASDFPADPENIPAKVITQLFIYFEAMGCLSEETLDIVTNTASFFVTKGMNRWDYVQIIDALSLIDPKKVPLTSIHFLTLFQKSMQADTCAHVLVALSRLSEEQIEAISEYKEMLFPRGLPGWMYAEIMRSLLPLCRNKIKALSAEVARLLASTEGKAHPRANSEESEARQRIDMNLTFNMIVALAHRTASTQRDGT